MSTSPSVTAETPTLTSSGGKAPDAVAKPPTKPSRQRFKAQLSCTLCRTRKLKCDRNSPCQNCIKRDLSSSCTFIHAGLRREKAAALQKSGNVGRKDVRSQISHLEQLVVSLMKKSGGIDQNRLGISPGPSSDGPRASDFSSSTGDDQWTEITGLSNTTESFGMINIDDDQPNYVGSSHWAAILDNIACLRDSIENTDPPKQDRVKKMETSKITGPELFNGSLKSATRTEILSALPGRKQVNFLLDKYFGHPDITSLVHEHKFRNDCDKFWKDPSQTPITWIGMLFAILSQSMKFELMAGRSPFNGNADEIAAQDPAEIIEMYRQKTVQCLFLGKYLEPGPYIIETLLLYYVCEHFRTPDAQFGSWALFGFIIRAALRLGLHRDASHYPKISVFQGEMNRRIWHTIVHLDLLTSCSMGLPRMIREGMHDAQCPRNLADEDFNENSQVLPRSRPAEELTPIGCFNAKHQITEVFGTILDQANSTNLISYEEVMSCKRIFHGHNDRVHSQDQSKTIGAFVYFKLLEEFGKLSVWDRLAASRLDKLLHATYEMTPESLRTVTVEDLKYGSPDLKTQKFGIGLVFQKSKCILHRKLFILSKTSPPTYPYPYSMKTCIDASMNILTSWIFLNRQVISVPHLLCSRDIKTLLDPNKICLTYNLKPSTYIRNSSANSKISHREMQPGNELYDHKWKLSSLLAADFLLAAMLLCLYVSHTMLNPDLERSNAQLGIRIEATREEMIQVLNDCHDIWESTKSTSKDAYKAASTLKALLSKMRATPASNITTSAQRSHASSDASTFASSSQSTKAAVPWLNKQVVQPATYSWNTPPSFDPPSNETSNIAGNTVQPSLDFGGMDLDWELWDNQFYNNGGSSRTPPDLWNFDPNSAGIQFPDPNGAGFMQWGQQM
ncbi:hypothetical protein HYALB_00006440 [Hymenoscyphus albidus]|uniref:Zn(2)-C6 fungal-type domain-containing protein n=1 Tax=Hymenoscyphus albidus TaxID=595503 RepID=A0A9N9LGC9_9HELO|nr:hypothetical protein HYALB_00006440 [Hymenoscyphus albidus]